MVTRASGNRDNVTVDMSLRALFWHLGFQRAAQRVVCSLAQPCPALLSSALPSLAQPAAILL